mgnify:CR=1 FL=1
MNMSNEIKIALIYARVSTKKQDPKSQLIRCEEYCKQNGYRIEKIFKDKFTGGGDFLERPAMRDLLQYAKTNIHKQYVVVFDDLKRFARDTKFHIDLRATFDAIGLTPKCLNYSFDNSPEGRFMETIHAAQNELERHQNRRQVIQKQRARLTAGYNAFIPPKGYKKIHKDPIHGTIDVPNEYASVMKKALKMFAYSELQTRKDVADFLKKKGVLGKQESFRYLETVKHYLSNVFYAGYIEYKPWDVERRKGKHKPLITLQEYNLIQSRLRKTDHAKPIRKDINSEYPLRGFINCYYCKKKLTACKSRGRWGGQYHKYYCSNKKCELRNMTGIIKSVSRDDLHNEFKSLLNTFRPSLEIHRLTHKVFDDVIEDQIKTDKTLQKEKEAEKTKIELEIDSIISLVANPKTSEMLRERYEKKIIELAQKIEDIDASILKKADIKTSYRTPSKGMFEMLKNPYKIWVKSDIIQKQKLFYFLFEENLEYQPEVGFRTPKKALPIRLFEQFSTVGADYVMMVDVLLS